MPSLLAQERSLCKPPATPKDPGLFIQTDPQRLVAGCLISGRNGKTLRLFRIDTGVAWNLNFDPTTAGDSNLTNAVRLLSQLFIGGPSPSAAFLTCNPDPTIDELSCEALPFLGCYP